MKRILCLFLSILLLLPMLSGCGNSEKATTIMVYMIGSDLEARAGAGTNDMKEMLASGVDLDTTNVLVYAGGTKKWHNEVAAVEQHTLLRLTPEGFVELTSMPVASMGESASLSAFLNYAYENCPAQKYSLVMWDHGDGPVIGYGKDMLYDNDSLTLQEMKNALDDSPFGADNKLSWVGFDACLMASAELACVWADYADYLVASQEIEPAFGWNYDFLGNVGKVDIPTLLKGITENYLTACEEYYEKKNFDNRDTTLACMDLSKADGLEQALNGLFAKATADVAQKYDQLVAQRVETRALGRASTGSEYDLVDLDDMADKLNLLYPNEANALKQAIKEMVVANANNTVGCCGMSLYYPFYNKPYFERDWNTAYTNLGLFSDYQAYLKAYTAIWTQSDRLDSVAASVQPTLVQKGEYELKMSADQAAAYADSRYFILQREGEGLYTVVFASRNITREGNVLSANFDGNVLYAKNQYNQFVLPVTQEHDVVGENTHYSAYVNLTNRLDSFMESPDGYSIKTDGYRFHLAVNNANGKVTVGSLVPGDLEGDSQELMGGKAEDADLSQYTKYIFPEDRHRYLSRHENGVIKSMAEWKTSSYFSGYVLSIGDGLEFTMAPLVAGEYYLLYEIEDTQGNRYCSEMLPIQSDGQLPQEYFPEAIEIAWDSGDQVKLFEESGVTVYLNRTEILGNIEYCLSAQNRNDFDIYVSGDNLFINDTVYCHDGLAGLFRVPAGGTATYEYGMSFGDAANLGLTEGIRSLQFSVNITDYFKCTTLVKDQTVYLTLSDKTTLPKQDEFLAEYNVYDQTVRGGLAKEQVLLKGKNDLTITLMGLGGNGITSALQGAVRLENRGDTTRYVQINGLVFNDVYVPVSSARIGVFPGATAYDCISISEDNLDLSMIQSIDQVDVVVRFLAFDTLVGGGGFVENATYSLKMAQSASPPVFTLGPKVLLDEKGLRITLKSTRINGTSGMAWYLTLENNTDRAISLDLAELSVNGTAVTLTGNDPVAVYDSNVGAGQKCLFYISYWEELSALKDITFRLAVMDFEEESILEKLDTQITLAP